MKMHAGHIEVMVSILLDYRLYTIVPNVSYGLGLNHECDLLALDSNGRFTEIEIKTTLSDLKADFKKGHGHKSKFISRLIYAFPEEILEKGLPLIPEKCGIIIIKKKTHVLGDAHYAEWHRRCRHDPLKEKPSQAMINKFYHLGCMRIWTLKAHNNKKISEK